MLDRAQPGFRTTELDPDLLSTPFTCQTNWHVITGAPCCGKTTLINRLAGMGFQTLPEIGRAYIEREMAKGRTIDEIREDEVTFCHRINDMTLERERDCERRNSSFSTGAFPIASAFSASMDWTRTKSCRNASIIVMPPCSCWTGSLSNRTA